MEQEARLTGRDGIVEMRGIVKRFGDLIANDRVDLEIRPGEVLGLLGENGAGKTTLMRVLYGIYRLDGGEIRINGQPVDIRSPADAIELGIGMIHQKFLVVPTMTVAENVVLGAEPTNGALLDRGFAERQVLELASRYGILVNPRAKVGRISLGEQQCTEILKALYRKADLLILDEPTTVLTPQQMDELFDTLRKMAANGGKVVIITHKLPEVLAVTDRVVVLRDGKVVGSYKTQETTERELAIAMVGRDLRPATSVAKDVRGTVLKVEGISARNDEGRLSLKGVSMEARAGEILGVGGIGGNGQRELVEVIAGLRPTESGRIIIRDRELRVADPRRVRAMGVCYVPADRHGMGTVGPLSVAENLILQRHAEAPFSRRMFLRHSQIRTFAEGLVASYDIHCQGVDAQTRTLSGGNLQRLVLARELSGEPDLILAEYPTRGLDIAATEYVHHVLQEQRDRGAAVVAVFSDLDELLQLSDRVVIMYEGHIMGELSREEFDVERIGLMMAGVAESKAEVRV